MFSTLRTVAERRLPSWLYLKLGDAWAHDGFKKYFANTGWLFLARIVTYGVSFFTIAFVARYLGPENFGKLSYAQSFVAIFSVFASLGIDNILYRDLVSHPEKEHELLGTAIFSKLIFGSLSFIFTVLAAFLLNADIVLSALIFIISLTFIFQPFAIINHLFSARVQSKYYAYTTVLLAFIIAGSKLALIYLGEGILYFAGLIALETALYSLFFLVIYICRFQGKPWRWRFSPQIFVRLFRDSWPMLLAGFSAFLYGRIDQVMIQHYLGSASVGMYDAAVRLTEIWIFFPSIIIASLFPAITNAHQSDMDAYARRFRALILLTLGIILCITIPIFILAPFIVSIVFGNAFSETSSILRIYIWSGIGITIVALMQSYLVTENRGKHFLLITLAGAATNILLNLMLIPALGMKGSAIATLLSFVIMLGVLLLFPKNRAGLRNIVFPVR